MNASFSFDQIKPYLLPIITVVVVVVLLPLVILPWFSDARNHLTSLDQQRTKLTAVRTKADALDKMDTSTNKQLLNTQVEPAMPSEADPAGVLGTLEQVAAAAGAQAKGVHFGQAATPTASSASADNSAVSANLSVEGSYASIFSFISQSETVARVVSLSTLHILPASDNKDQLIATFDVLAPYQPLPTDLGPVETPLPDRTDAKNKTLTKVSKLHQAPYAPTPDTSISGRPSPF
jgi:Tfp pilus assembly protein PilO